MGDYKISCCSTVDFNLEKMKELGIPYLAYCYSIDGIEFKDDFEQTMSMKAFYRKMLDGADTKTYGVNVARYEEFFRKQLEDRNDLLHITMSSGISGSYQAACVAAEEVRKEYPGQKLVVVDSKCISGGYGLLVEEAVKKQKDGLGFENLKEWILANRFRVHHWFFSTDLTFYVKGGRISKLSGIVGGIFEICPLMEVDKEGKLAPRMRIRTKKKVIQEAVSKMEKDIEEGNEYCDPVILNHSDCLLDCLQVKELVLKKFPRVKDVPIYSIGTTIGCHTGPGTVALYFWGKERNE